MVASPALTSEVNISDPATFTDDFSKVVNITLQDYSCLHRFDSGAVICIPSLCDNGKVTVVTFYKLYQPAGKDYSDAPAVRI